MMLQAKKGPLSVPGRLAQAPCCARGPAQQRCLQLHTVCVCPTRGLTIVAQLQSGLEEPKVTAPDAVGTHPAAWATPGSVQSSLRTIGGKPSPWKLTCGQAQQVYFCSTALQRGYRGGEEHALIVWVCSNQQHLAC